MAHRGRQAPRSPSWPRARWALLAPLLSRAGSPTLRPRIVRWVLVGCAGSTRCGEWGWGWRCVGGWGVWFGKWVGGWCWVCCCMRGIWRRRRGTGMDGDPTPAYPPPRAQYGEGTGPGPLGQGDAAVTPPAPGSVGTAGSSHASSGHTQPATLARAVGFGWARGRHTVGGWKGV